MKRIEKNKEIRKQIKNEVQKKKVKTFSHRSFKIFLFIVTMILFIYIFGDLIGTYPIVVKEYSPTFSNLPKSFSGFKIVHFTDLHFDGNINKLKRLNDKIEEIDPDILVFTGDLINKVPNKSEKKILIKYLSSMNAKYNKYFVSGNHDNKLTKEILEKANFINLNNSHDLINSKENEMISITGLDDNIHKRTNIKETYDFKEKKLFNILIMHEPDLIDDVLKIETPQIALAGHSHGGQVRIPIIEKSIVKVPLARKYPDDYYQVQNTKLYVSSGLGSTGIHIRFFNFPSINLYRLRLR